LGQPLFKLEPNAVPYVFPFLLHDDDDFDYIREQGIQILRWEEFTPSDNKDVETLRERLIQIPCHQNLTFIELQKIITIINKR
jgi:perosamine synthetase